MAGVRVTRRSPTHSQGPPITEFVSAAQLLAVRSSQAPDHACEVLRQ